MNKSVTILTSLLIAQLAIWGLLSLSDSNNQSTEQQNVLTLNKEAIKEITITTSDNSLTLQYQGTWQLKGSPELAVNQDIVAQLTEQLAKAKLTWPVTTTSSSHERFKVSAQSFEKKLSFINKEGQQQVLYLGTSPSFKQVYSRNEKSDDVYAIEFSQHQAAADLNQWFDKSLLAMRDVTELTFADINLAKNQEQWLLSSAITPLTTEDQLSEANKNKSLNQSNINELVAQFNNLTVNEVANVTPEEFTSITLTNKEKQKYSYSLAQQDESYFINRDDKKLWFTLNKTSYEKIIQADLEFVFQTPENNQAEQQSQQAIQPSQNKANAAGDE